MRAAPPSPSPLLSVVPRNRRSLAPPAASTSHAARHCTTAAGPRRYCKPRAGAVTTARNAQTITATAAAAATVSTGRDDGGTELPPILGRHQWHRRAGMPMARMALDQGFPNLGISSCSVNSPPQRLPLRDSRAGDPGCLFPIHLRCSTALLRPRLDIFVHRSGDYMQLALDVTHPSILGFVQIAEL